ncbi:hypothetical protein [Sebaldella sp. S0638]|uniref:hypothetical protein n=1 Tax=Sebaldella sp. S0638 TaxID=2957809 RepID=UPI00209E1932|nr:hypothetical protein [Sebaldella sp. S0638]MCP1226700.1 hypothetical protein [Sebaldella sp. S0638]
MNYGEAKKKVMELFKESKLSSNEALLLVKEVEVLVLKEKIETEELVSAFEKEMLKK